jgi:O-antigen/teichoic acid export membrane protein
MTSWSWRHSAGLLSLYGSRLAGIVVTLVFLPLYARLLGQHDFGIVAMVLSGQMLMAMLDLGMANLIARDLAATPEPGRALAQWRGAERLLTFYFVALGVVAVVVVTLAGMSPWWALAGGLLYWALTLQNLSQSALLGRGEARLAALLQGAGVLARAGLTAATLLWIDCSLRGFVVSQAAGALVHLLVSRYYGQAPMARASAGPAAAVDLPALARRGLPLFLVGVAGAAVLQADKLIVGAFMSPAAVAPYFLATTFCMTPISILAGPVAQFFQPQVISATAAADEAGVARRTHGMTLALLLTVVAPTVGLWLWCEPLIRWWLHDAALAAEVVRLSAWLLPAAAIGAIGNVPVTLLNAVSDFAHIARVSALCTVLTLAGTALAAQQHRLEVVCAIYLVYYLTITVALWGRANGHAAVGPAARRSARLAGACLGLVGLVMLAVRW